MIRTCLTASTGFAGGSPSGRTFLASWSARAAGGLTSASTTRTRITSRTYDTPGKRAKRYKEYAREQDQELRDAVAKNQRIQEGLS